MPTRARAAVAPARGYRERIQRDGGTREVVIRVNAKRRMEEEDGIEGGRGGGWEDRKGCKHQQPVSVFVREHIL